MKTQMLKKYLFIGSLMILQFNFAFSQSQNRCWVIADNNSGNIFNMKFNGSGPIVQIHSVPTAAEFSYNAMQDINGNLLFYIADGSIYDAHDNFIDYIPINSTSTNNVVGTPEVLIVPVPGNCSQYYIIMATATVHSPTGDSQPQPCYVILDMSLPNNQAGVPVSSRGALLNQSITFVNAGLTTNLPHASSMLLGVSKLHVSGSTPSRLLFVADNLNLLEYVITNAGIVPSSLNPIAGLACNFALRKFNSELEVHEDASGNYVIAYPGFDCGINIFKLDAAGALMTTPGSAFTVPLLSTNGKVRGLEFSESGDYLYITNTADPYLQYIKLTLSVPIALDLQTATGLLPSQAQDFKDSQIEMAYDHKIYFAASDRMGTLNFPENPTGSNSFTNHARDINASFLPGVGTVTSFFINDPIRMLPDQIDGEVYQVNASNSPTCCAANTVFNDVISDFTVEIPGTWTTGSGNPFGFSGTITVSGTLTINEGVDLTLQGMRFEFMPGAKVIVKSGIPFNSYHGATLTLDNTTFTSTSCGVWNGIEVWGNNSFSQYSNEQGKLIIIDGSRIENALNAIRVYDPGNIWATTGGIVQASNSSFYNNRNSIEFRPYRNFFGSANNYVSNLSYFNQCDFRVDDNYQGGSVLFYEHATLHGISGIHFKGCVFENTQTGITDDRLLGMGIHSLDSRFYVEAACKISTNPPCPNPYLIYSSFTGFKYGINATGSTADKDRYFRVNKTNFSRNTYGIWSSAVNSISILDNVFDLGVENTSGGNHPEQFGIYINTGAGYIIEENHMLNSTGGEHENLWYHA